MCFTYSSSYPRLFRQDDRKARKLHNCCECDMPIRPGEIYLETFGVWDGQAATYRTCTTCQWLRERVGAAEMEDGCGVHEAYPAFSLLYEALDDGHDVRIGLVPLEVLD